MGDGSNKIFLVEFVVRRIQLQNSLCSEQYGKEVWSLGRMWVVFRIPSCPPVEICETNWTPDEDPVFNAAKSVLFGLSDEQLYTHTDFSIDVGVLKRMPDGVLPDQVFVGHAVLNLSDEFNSMMRSLATECCALPESREVVRQLILTGTRPVGTICILTRFTCFGAMIVSKFDQNVKEYEDKDFTEKEPEIKPCTGGDDGEPCWTKDFDQKTDGRTSSAPGYSTGGGESVIEEEEEEEEEENKEDEFEEIEAIMNGHGFTIRVPKHVRKLTFDQECRCNPDEESKECHCLPNPNKDGVNIFAREEEDGNLLVEIPGDCQPCSITGEKKPPQQAGSEQCYVIKKSHSQGNVFGVTNLDMKLPLKVPKDACLVRISKKSRTTREKTQYLFEIQTPQEPEKPKEKVNQSTQYLETDIPKEAPPEGADKGKDNKGKGKGKGGKKGKKK